MKKFIDDNKLFFSYLAYVVAIVALLFFGYQIWRLRQLKPQTSQNQQPNQTAQTAETPATTNPLQIEAIKARSYPGSVIVVEQNVASIGGYKTQIVSYDSDGNKVYALLTYPVGTAPSGGWPVVILNHGYINPATYQTNDGSYITATASLARAGIAVIKPDYRGHGKSQGVPEGGHFSPVYAYDDLNLISSIAKSPELALNANRLGTMGYSLGAHTSLRVAVVNPNIKATAYLSGVVASAEDIIFNWPHSPAPRDLPAVVQTARQKLIEMFGNPSQQNSFWYSVSAINFVGNITGASQIQHSESDSEVPKAFSDKLDTALKAAGKPVEYYVYPGDDHQLSKNSTQVYPRLVEFFKTNL